MLIVPGLEPLTCSLSQELMPIWVHETAIEVLRPIREVYPHLLVLRTTKLPPDLLLKTTHLHRI